ncbi:MAG: AgmX/PglI C-terminal domain-containing protein [Polyangiaceae bacterium]|nr:AgmX/PglI C-terminal domain-containing protein [Polyangiaceae bacterium]MCW5789993.1 AgmX/PglI C-terminal domain-containing protein [Polyangiaceae bacterium]
MRALLTAITLSLVGCSATTLRATAPEEPAETEARPPDLSGGASPSGGDSSSASAGDTPTGDRPASRTDCPLDTKSGADAAETAGVAGQPRDIEVMQKVVSAHRGCVRRCYESLRAKQPDLAGDLTMTLEITPTGEVKEAKLNAERSNLTNAELVSCAAGVLKQLKFPDHPKGFESTLNYPFNFQP